MWVAQNGKTANNNFEEIVMGKYLLGWLLGVPVIVLVIIYFFMH